MPSQFSSSELCQLLSAAFTVEDEADAVLTIALKACVAEGVPTRLVLWQVFESWRPSANYPLKKLFRALARLDQLDALAVLLDHTSQAVRLGVIHAYYNFGVAADVPTLERLLTDQDPKIRVSARDAIDAILDSKNIPRTRQAVDGGLSDTDLRMTRVMLGRQLEPTDVVSVAHLLFAPSGPIRQLARNAFQSSSQWTADALMDSIEQAIASGTPMSTEAVGILRDLGSHRAIALLIRALPDSGTLRGDRPRTALESLGPKAASQLLEAFELDPNVRRRWGALVARVAGPRALPALLAAFESPYDAVRHNAADGLLTLRDATSVSRLITRLERANDDDIVEILRVLGGLSSSAAQQAILRCAERQEPRVRIAAIRALHRFNTPEATAVIIKAVMSSNWRIREAAVDVVGSWDWQNLEVAALLSDAFHDRDRRVSAAAARSLQQLAHASSLEEHATGLAHTLEQGDENEAARATEEIAKLRGLLAFNFAQSRLFEDSSKWHDVIRRIKAVSDLSPYESIAQHWMALPAASARVASSEQRQQSAQPQPITDNVRFSVTCPLTVTAPQACVLDVWVHSAHDLDTVLRWARADPRARSNIALRSKGPVAVNRGTTLAVKLEVPTLNWSDEDTVYWTGDVGNASYSFVVPDGASKGDHAGYVLVLAAGMQIARVSFLITVGNATGTVDDVTSRQRRVTSAFASYAAEDRNEVLARVQGMLSVVPDLDIFVDVMSLRSGEHWEERLEEEILNRDVLYLFWSEAAKRSPWVDREWRIALRARGLDGIDPVPLEPPDISPPPQELAALHFNEWTLYFRRP